MVSNLLLISVNRDELASTYSIHSSSKSKARTRKQLERALCADIAILSGSHRPKAAMTGGRRRFLVWQYFDAVCGTKDVTCKKCNLLISNAKVEKLDRHILNYCGQWSQNEKNAFSKAAAQERQPVRCRTSVESSVSISGDIRETATSFTPVTQDALNKLVADYIYSSGAPFRTVERPHFVAAMLVGRPPGLTVPSRALVSGRLLDEAYDEEMEILIELLKAQPFVAVVVDGCTTVRHQKKVNFILVAPNMLPRPWKIVATRSETQSGEYIAGLTLDVAHEVDSAVGRPGFVTGASTDNAKAMVAAWKILENNGIICAGCGAHTLNLLLEDIAKLLPVKALVQKVTRIAMYFLSRPKLYARFEEERAVIIPRQGESAFNNTLSIPTATRWYSTYNAIASVIKNKEALLTVFQDGAVMDEYKPKKKKTSRKRKRGEEVAEKSDYEDVEGALLDDEFWKNGKLIMKLLVPIIKKIGLLEGDGSSAGMVYWCFADLLKKPLYCQPSFMIDTVASIMQLIVERWNFIHTDAMAVAFLLDPTKDPNDFVDNDKAIALEHVRDIGARMGYSKDKQVLAYQEASRFVNQKLDRKQEGRQMEGHDMPPLEWWGFYRDKYPNLFDIARRVFTMPTSSAAAERSWSMYKYIHSKLRNGLLTENIEKLMFVYANRMARGNHSTVVYDQATLHHSEDESGDEDDNRDALYWTSEYDDTCYDYDYSGP